MKWIHIACGILALAAGFTALFATKGSPLHRRSGTVFFAVMLVMSSTGAVLAWLKPDRGSVVAGLLTFYLVSTAWLTVKRPVDRTRGVTAALMLLAMGLAAFGFAYGIEATQSANGRVDGIPAPPLFLFGAAALLAAAMDARLLWAGRIEGAHRLARHLWRMTYAMWIATTSAFLGEAKFFPMPIRKSGLLALPVLLVTGMLLFWLVRVYWKRRRVALPRTGEALADG
ncbi:DUF2306 domain-containing protein [Agrilutibacter solisilvae]|uniref:DUF2306 domain-containing protein n=1 Tax=Agrilutibacter solisilvae TaxID=2763317 RepID=A0A974Y103_9GAMM|nr:DUF2306 domain-containing protein [Lysobacter solisilvae]QSX79422.1 hypothetical protein I8J32_006050 [Lysobacter solisilvae]